MLTKKQVEEIKEHLDKAQNPLFFFDNDPDGLCSFVIMRKYCGKGKGVQAKSYPGMNRDYFRKVSELKADYIFILDKPVVDHDFFDEADRNNVPVVWIDHHDIERKKIPEFVHYYNPLFNKQKSNEPVTHLCYQISGRKEDLWLDIIGCVSDHFIPKSYKEFMKSFPELSIDAKEPFDILYKSQIGKIARIFGFALKDTTSNVVDMMKFLVKAKGPYDILEENSENKTIHGRFSEIDKKYNRLLNEAMKPENKNDKMIFFQYGGDLSISEELANGLMYNFPEKMVIVIRVNGLKANISARGNGIREIFLKSIEDIPDSRGGGHENAVGGQMMVKDIEKFRENLQKSLIN